MNEKLKLSNLKEFVTWWGETYNKQNSFSSYGRAVTQKLVSLTVKVQVPAPFLRANYLSSLVFSSLKSEYS